MSPKRVGFLIYPAMQALDLVGPMDAFSAVTLADGKGRRRPGYTQYMSHYHEERNHQGLENRLLRPLRAVGESHARVKRRRRLGGMLSYYYLEAA